MAHTDHTGAADTVYRTPRAWLPAAAQATAWVNRTARRRDLSVSIGPEAAKEAGTAFYSPRSADIELSTGTLLPGVKPEDFNLSNKLWKLRNAPFMGAMAHECAHAAWSLTVPADLAAWRGPDGERFTRREVDVAVALEESRVEYLLLKRSPTLKAFVRRMAMEIVNKDFEIADTRYGASIGAALTVARVDAGSVTRPAGKRFAKLLAERLDKPTLDGLRKLWIEYQTYPQADSKFDYPYAEVKRIAADWIALVVDPDEEKDDLASPDMLIAIGMGEGEGDESEGSDESGKGEGSGEGSGESDGEGAGDKPEGDETEGEGSGKGKLAEELGDIAREETVEIDTELGEDAKTEMTVQAVKDRALDSERKEEGERTASRVFGKMHGRGGVHSGRDIRRRAPKADERAAATRLAKELAKITTHDKVAVRTSSMLPPGRVHGRSAVLGSAQIAQRQTITAEPFVSTRRKHVETDKIVVGVLTDVSGSMGGATEPLGVTSWVVAAAAAKVDAKYCSILFGDRAEGMVRPGTKVPDVVVAEACDGSEHIEPALKAVDHELNLLDGTGTRVLVILSDGCLVLDDQAEYCESFLRLAKARGVTVLWCYWRAFESNHGYGKALNLWGKTPAECAAAIGQEVVRAVAENQRKAA